MKKYFIIGFLMFMCSNTIAEGIFKWTDENGKVHYGDKSDNAKNSTQLKIRAPEMQSSKEGASTTKTNKNSSNTVTIDTNNLQSCLGMARSMVNKKNMTPSEIREESKRLLDMCPGTAYNCVTYIERQENNNCTAVPMEPGGTITRNNTYKR